MSGLPPRPMPGRSSEAPTYRVDCEGCGAPTSYHEAACSYCTRPTGRHPSRVLTSARPMNSEQVARLRAEFERHYSRPGRTPILERGTWLDTSTIERQSRVFIPDDPQRDRR
jgi:hypothetical protein